jgi:hypothetical protein
MAFGKTQTDFGVCQKNNGVEVIKETANGGSESVPTPITKEYTIP